MSIHNMRIYRIRLLSLFLPLVKHRCAALFIDFPGLEQVIDDRQDLVGHGDDGLLVTTASSDAVVASVEIGVLAAGRCPRRLHQSRLEPGCPVTDAGASVFAGAFIVAAGTVSRIAECD